MLIIMIEVIQLELFLCSEFDGGGRGGLRSEDLSEGGVRLNRLTAR